MNDVSVGPPPHWLAIAEEEFVPADSGGRVESLNMLLAAVAAGVRLHVIVPGMTEGSSAAAHRRAIPEADVDGIERRTDWTANLSVKPYIISSRPLPKGFVERMRATHEKDPFDAVLAVSFRVVHLGAAVAGALSVPLLVRPHNVESRYFGQLAKSASFPKNLLYRLEALKLHRYESALHRSRRVAGYADIGETDAQWRSRQTTSPVVHLPPFLPALGQAPALPDRLGPDNRLTVLFLGALDNPNNVDGVRWFTEECWPQLRRANRDVDFHVVGRRAPELLVRYLQDAGARVTIDAPAVAPHLASADIFVNPVRRGAGVNIKMVEAMSAGLAVVSSETGARGMPWQDGQHLVVADDAESFTSAVQRLIDDPVERLRLGRQAVQFVTTELDGVRQIGRMRALLS
ncbi:glycosyltransferase [Nakamurella sp. GG22]